MYSSTQYYLNQSYINTNTSSIETTHDYDRCLLSNVYSLWFIHLPYYMNSLEKGQRDACLRMAFNYLLKMQSAKLINTDEVLHCFINYYVIYSFFPSHTPSLLTLK